MAKYQNVIKLVNYFFSIPAAAMYIVSRNLSISGLKQIGPGMFTMIFISDHLINLLELNNHSIPFIIDSLGQIITINGFCILTTGKAPEIGSWLVAVGLVIKTAILLIDILLQGLEKTFGNDNKFRNIVFRIICLSLGGTIGAIVIGVGASLNFMWLDYIGAHIIGAGVLFGSIELFYTNLSNELHSVK